MDERNLPLPDHGPDASIWRTELRRGCPVPKRVTPKTPRPLSEQERRTAQQILVWILRHGMSQKDLGDELDVNQSTISRWRRLGVPERFDELDFEPLQSLQTRLVGEWVEHISREAILPSPPPYLCSKAASYPEDRKAEAEDLLRRRVQPSSGDAVRGGAKPGADRAGGSSRKGASGAGPTAPPAGFREFSVTTQEVSRGGQVQSRILTKIVLPGDLPPGVDAHCYLDDPVAPSLFVVLVSRRLTPLKQREVAHAEIDAHLLPHLDSPVEPPRASRLLGRRLVGGAADPGEPAYR